MISPLISNFHFRGRLVEKLNCHSDDTFVCGIMRCVIHSTLIFLTFSSLRTAVLTSANRRGLTGVGRAASERLDAGVDLGRVSAPSQEPATILKYFSRFNAASRQPKSESQPSKSDLASLLRPDGLQPRTRFTKPVTQGGRKSPLASVKINRLTDSGCIGHRVWLNCFGCSPFAKSRTDIGGTRSEVSNPRRCHHRCVGADRLRADGLSNRVQLRAIEQRCSGAVHSPLACATEITRLLRRISRTQSRAKNSVNGTGQMT